MSYHINISEAQRELLRIIFPPSCRRLRKHDPFDILEAIFYIVYTGCQWSRLPLGYPPYQTVYYHYRRLMRNYEQFLHTAGYMTMFAMVFFMLGYFR